MIRRWTITVSPVTTKASTATSQSTLSDDIVDADKFSSYVKDSVELDVPGIDQINDEQNLSAGNDVRVHAEGALSEGTDLQMSLKMVRQMPLRVFRRRYEKMRGIK